MRGITICVDYFDVLSVTLPRNASVLESVLVVSSPADDATADVVSRVANASLLKTDAFYRDGAAFNKGAAMEEGFDRLGRFQDEWIAILDADIIAPKALAEFDYVPGFLYSPYRRMLFNPATFRDDIDWDFLPHQQDKEFAGYCQIFYANDPVLRDAESWYGTGWKHAGGCDSEFAFKWPPRRLKRTPFHVLHLGRDGQNWMGRVTPYLDGTTPPEAAARTAAMQEMMRVRDASGGRHEHEKVANKAASHASPSQSR